MTEELKTLRDIENELGFTDLHNLSVKDTSIQHNKVLAGSGNEGERGLLVRDLRAEAIKWVKYLQSRRPETIYNEIQTTAATYNQSNYFNQNSKEDRGDSFDQAFKGYAIAEWIKHFFGITKEDLR